MTRRTVFRLRDIQEAIKRIRSLLKGMHFDDLYADPDVRAAFERYLEVASEASRHIPEDLKTQYGPDIPWRKVADLGNVLRHTYHKSDVRNLWDIYVNDLDALDRAVSAMIDVEDQSRP